MPSLHLSAGRSARVRRYDRADSRVGEHPADVPAGAQAGTFVTTDTTVQRKFELSTNVQYMTHAYLGTFDGQTSATWHFNWVAWAPAVECEWRAFVTIHALKVLRANGRL